MTTEPRPLDVGDLAPGEVRRVMVDDLPLCVARLADGTVRAVHDACTHYKIRLSRGELVGDAIECPAHGSLFSMETGAVVGLPAYEPLRTYPVTDTGDGLVVDIASGAPISNDEIADDVDDLEEEDIPS